MTHQPDTNQDSQMGTLGTFLFGITNTTLKQEYTDRYTVVFITIAGLKSLHITFNLNTVIAGLPIIAPL